MCAHPLKFSGLQPGTGNHTVGFQLAAHLLWSVSASMTAWAHFLNESSFISLHLICSVSLENADKYTLRVKTNYMNTFLSITLNLWSQVPITIKLQEKSRDLFECLAQARDCAKPLACIISHNFITTLWQKYVTIPIQTRTLRTSSKGTFN